DRFGVVGTVEDLAEARSIAQRIERVLAEPFEVDGTLLSVSTSIGAAWGSNAPSARLLFDRAELALGVARTNGGRQLRFHEPNDDVTGWRDLAAFASDVRMALAQGQIFVAYQPIVELGTGRLAKLEALARWNHPVRGEITPDVFIPLAERSGTIDELGEWILDRSCADIARLASQGIVAEISVNMSAAQLRDLSIVERVAVILERHLIDPGRVWIEVTESVLLNDKALGPLHRLHDLGVHLVIDDFGTGYATFQYLTRLPVDALKIDTAFVRGLGVDASDTAIVRSVINLARELGLEVIAEGVETESQRAQLVALECRLAQGWLFSAALAFDELVATYGRGDVALLPAIAQNDAALEAQRVAALRACKILDTTADVAFDSIVLLASQLLATPMALVSLIDSTRQWFKARVGVDITETPRDISICNQAIAHPRTPFVVNDLLLDDRFENNPLVVGGPAIRSYAGIPIRSREGLPIGTLCVLDTVPRTFTDEQVQQLTMLADQTGAMLDLRRRAAELNDLLRKGRHGDSLQPADHVDVTQSARDGATAVGEAVVELTRISERRDDTPGQPANVLQFGALELRLSARSVLLDGRDIDITAKEFDLLAFLATNAGRAFTRAELLHEVWHSAPSWQNAATVTEHIYRLRSKIETDAAHPLLLRTVRGTGYLFEPTAGESNGEARAVGADPRSGEFTHDETHIVGADSGMLDMMMTTELSDVVGHDILDVVAPSSHPAAQARLEMRASGHAPGPQVIALLTTTGAEVVTVIRSEDGDLDELPVVVVSVREVLDPPHLMRQLVNGVVNEVSDAVIVTDPGLHVLSWNPAAQRLYGWSEREVLGHTLQNVVRALEPLDLDAVRAEIEKSGRWSSDARQITRDGAIIDVQTTLNVICDDNGAVTAIVAVNRPERERAPIQAVLGHATSNWSDVQRAVNRSEFVVYYEPVVSLADRSVMGVNVRVRWLRPDGGSWDLVDFISDIEHAHALGDLARYVYPTAFLQFERWHRAGRSIELFVDVSANQLADQDFLDVLAPVIVRLRVAGSSLWLKVRESDLRFATAATHTALQSLATAGARILVGGLGSGSTSAAGLGDLPVDALAFDATLIDGEKAAGMAKARRVVALGDELEIAVWVEGVLDERQHSTAIQLGCACGNGRLYGGPTLGDHLDVTGRDPDTH
ncbi:MAG: diguanylate cyclase/phosphodiesterase with sensor(s), partial [Ilumatobacteraceae bacterium]|nr:diguanylate cyclase/phosphodiesterase with sensor(s) [Ilumatobacteraceae bacterium]